MDTLRERIARIQEKLARIVCDIRHGEEGWQIEKEDRETATSIIIALEVDRAELLERVDQAEEDSLLMQSCNDLVIRDRAEDQAKLAAVENREKKLLDALKDMRRWCLKRAEDFALLSVRRGIYAELAARLSIILSATDAALAVKEEGK